MGGSCFIRGGKTDGKETT